MTDDTIPGQADLACPVCLGRAEAFTTIAARRYLRCPTCQARFLDPAHFLSPDAEHAHYLHHENEVDDPRYRRFLSKLADPLMARLPRAQTGWTTAAAPVLRWPRCCQRRGTAWRFTTRSSRRTPRRLSRSYDFITCTEVAEHFHHPAAEFARLRAMVRPGGWLAVMTCFQTDDARFATGITARTPRMWCSTGPRRSSYLARAWGWRCEIPAGEGCRAIAAPGGLG